jgi:hypothetical protein
MFNPQCQVDIGQFNDKKIIMVSQNVEVLEKGVSTYLRFCP